jgi:DNA-binding beta-propeller fold protein YncE
VSRLQASTSPLGALLALALAVPAAPADPVPPSIVSVQLIVAGPSLLDGFRRPLDLAADSSRGVLVVADTGNHRVVTLDATGRARGSLSWVTDDTKGRLCEPRGLALDARGRLYVVDALDDEVEVLTTTGSHLAALAPTGAGLVDLRPQDVAIGASGRIYVAYAGPRSGILVFDPRGAIGARIGFAAPGAGELRSPVSLAVSPDESEIAVLDPEAENAVRVYGVDGTLRAAFGRHGEGDGTFSMAAHVAWGPDATLWVTDTIRHSISVFDRLGTYRGRIGGFGHGPGSFNYPVACAFLARDRVAVLERAGARLQVLEVEVGQARAVSSGSGS